MNEAAQATPPALPKVDPETLAIRGRPERAIRFRRGVIIALVALGSVSLSAVAWIALRSHGGHGVIDQTQVPSLSGKPPSDLLSGLPASYSSVPQLGPPLPGDLGKPILEQQQTSLLSDRGQDQAALQSAATEHERAAAVVRSAHESSILIHGASATGVAAALGSDGAATDTGATSPGTRKLALDPANDPNNQQRKADFFATQDKGGDTNPYRLTAAPSPYLLSAGSVISASLITGLRSDLPGIVTAQVTESVYDSPTGKILLVPQGARLIGKYDSVVAFGQKRALVVWERIIQPDGSSVRLDNMPATDPAGYAGLQDKVDYHTWQLLKGVAVSTLLGIGSDLQFSGNSGLVEAIRQSGQQNVSRAGDELTAKALDIQPTLTVRPGAPVRLIVDRDLILAPWHS